MCPKAMLHIRKGQRVTAAPQVAPSMELLENWINPIALGNLPTGDEDVWNPSLKLEKQQTVSMWVAAAEYGTLVRCVYSTHGTAQMIIFLSCLAVWRASSGKQSLTSSTRVLDGGHAGWVILSHLSLSPSPPTKSIFTTLKEDWNQLTTHLMFNLRLLTIL